MMWSTAASGAWVDANQAMPERAARVRVFDRLLQANSPALSRLAASYTNSAADRDDLLQEVAMAVWQALPRFRGESSERTFLFRIAHNRAITHLARHRSRAVTAAEETEVLDTRPDPETELAHAQQGQRLFAAVRLLPVPYRQVVTLTLEGMEYSDIAQILGISESNVGVRLNRARQMLRKFLEDRK